jgi:radical SAM protein with 4Fe4S-binding SPASM domain
MISRDVRYGVNMVRQYYDYLMRRTRMGAKPSIVWIDTVSLCNFRCGFCPTTYAPNKGKGVMQFDTFKKIIDEVSTIHLEGYLFQTGEPLLNRDIVRFVQYMTSKNMLSIMHTNGSLWTRDKAAALLDAGLGFISFSFDGYDAETYEKTRVGGNFEQTVERIKGVLELKKKRGTARPYVRIQTLVPATGNDARFSEERARRFRALFEDLPVDEFDREKISNLAHDLPTGAVLKPEAPMSAGEHRDRGYRFKPCTRLWSSMTIRFDGTVVPCCVDFESQMPLGNVKNQTLLQIWNGEPLRQLREKHVKAELEAVPLCAKCDFPYGLDFAGVPVGMAGNQSLFRKYWGPEVHRMLLRPLRFHGGRVTRTA